jgi:septum formation inhibitor-activating ATPase MinD
MPISAVIPLDKEIATAVNRGVPVTVSASRSPAAKAMRDLAEQLLPQAAGGKAEGKSQKHADASAHNNGATKLPSQGRQSIMSRFNKQKDKKAA